MSENITLPPAEPTTIGGRLKGCLEESGKTQGWLAKKAGVGRSRVNRILNDRVTPSGDELQWLLKALGVDDPHFLDGAGVIPSEIEVRELEDMREARLRAEARCEALEQERDDLKTHYEEQIVVLKAECDDRTRIWAEQKERLQKENDATSKEVDDLHRVVARLQERCNADRQGYEEVLNQRDEAIATLTATRNRENARHSMTVIQLNRQLREKDAMLAKLKAEIGELKGLAVATTGLGVMSFIGFLASQD